MLRRLKRLARQAATGLEVAARSGARHPPFRRLFEETSAALDRALTPASSAAGPSDFYGADYFSGAGNPESGKRSGYDAYTRGSSNADALALLLLQHFDAERTLDVGCARGFVVEALREVGVDASGCDFSDYAVNTAARGARGHLRRGDLSGRLPYDDHAFGLVTCFETLEHLPPELARPALGELARVSAGVVVATIPSFGPRPPLPAGWFAGKLRGERAAELEALGPDYDGPVPPDALALDSRGLPLEGHLTIASFRWWRRGFEGAGLVHCPEVEVALYGGLERLGLAGLLDFYVFRHPGASVPGPSAARAARAAEVLRPQRPGRQA